MAKVALGNAGELIAPECLRALVLEFICTFLSVFIGIGAVMAASQLNGDPLVNLFVVAVINALAVTVMIASGINTSAGFLNPAITFGVAVGGHITIFRFILYCIDEILASSLACALLKYLTNGLVSPPNMLGDGISPLQGVIWEIILTFSVLFVAYATIVEPNKGDVGGLGPIYIGLLVVANIFAGAQFSGASMNPARSFGLALISGVWTNHWVYWVGPFIGGGLGGFLYQNFFISASHVPLSKSEDI